MPNSENTSEIIFMSVRRIKKKKLNILLEKGKLSANLSFSVKKKVSTDSPFSLYESLYSKALIKTWKNMIFILFLSEGHPKFWIRWNLSKMSWYVRERTSIRPCRYYFILSLLKGLLKSRFCYFIKGSKWCNNHCLEEK